MSRAVKVISKNSVTIDPAKLVRVRVSVDINSSVRISVQVVVVGTRRVCV